jgi:hypothetical protein
MTLSFARDRSVAAALAAVVWVGAGARAGTMIKSCKPRVGAEW